MDFLIVEATRWADLRQQDTPADDWDAAKAAAEALARRYGTRVLVLAVVGEVDGRVQPIWTRLAPAGGA